MCSTAIHAATAPQSPPTIIRYPVIPFPFLLRALFPPGAKKAPGPEKEEGLRVARGLSNAQLRQRKIMALLGRFLSEVRAHRLNVAQRVEQAVPVSGIFREQHPEILIADAFG